MKDKSTNKLGPFLNKHNNYSIRKFTVGTASILIGSTLFFGLSNEALAQSDNGNQSSVEQKANGQSIASSQINEENEAKIESSNINQSVSVPNVHEQTTEPKDTKVSQTTPSNQSSNDTSDIPTINKSNPKNEKHNQEDNKDKNLDENIKENKEMSQSEDKATSSKVKHSASNDKATPSKDKKDSTKEVEENIQSIDHSRVRVARDVPTYPNGDVEVDTSELPEAPQEFIDKYNSASDKLKLVRELLTDSYNEADVTEILRRLNIDLNKKSAQEAFKAVMAAGIKYANEQTSRYTVYAVTPSSSTNINNQSVNTVADLKRVTNIDPSRGLTINGRGNSAVRQTPARYTVHVKPNRRNNTMDYTITWHVDASAIERAHGADIGGFKFGSGYRLPSEIPGTLRITGPYGHQYSRNLIQGGRANFPQGYAPIENFNITRNEVQNGGEVEYKFKVPVRDWNGDLGFNGYVMMFENGSEIPNNNITPTSHQNYFYDETKVQGYNPNDPRLISTDDSSEVQVVPFQTEYVISKDLPVGQQEVQREGQNGKRGTLYTSVSYNNQLIGRFVKQTYDVAPVNKIVKIGVGSVNDSNLNGPLAPILEPQLSGDHVISGETSPNAEVTIYVSGNEYHVTANDSGHFTYNLPSYTLREGDHISAIATVNGKKSNPGKMIIPRDGRTPNLNTNVQRGENNNKPGSWVTVTNATTGQQISRFFVPDGLPGQDGRSITITNEYLDQNTGDRVIHFSDGRTIRIPKGPKGDKGDRGETGATGARGPQGLQGQQGL